MTVGSITPLATAALRWQPDDMDFDFETTADFEPQEDVLGQEAARESLSFAFQTQAHGQNVYVRGAVGTGRRTMVYQLLDKLAPRTDALKDRAYVNNFQRPDRPRLLTFAPGSGRKFKQQLQEVLTFIDSGLMALLESESVGAEREAIEQRVSQEIQTLSEPLEAELKSRNMAMVPIQQGEVTQTVIFALVDGQAVPPSELAKMAQAGQFPEAEFDKFREDYPEMQRELQRLGVEVSKRYQQGAQEAQAVAAELVRDTMDAMKARITTNFTEPEIAQFLDEVIDDVIETRMLGNGQPLPKPAERYGINLVLEHTQLEAAPIVEEQNPSLINLMGAVEPEWHMEGPPSIDFRGIRGGSLLRADGGFLILDVNDLLTEPGAWQMLKRVLRTGLLEVAPADPRSAGPGVFIKPEAIAVQLRVVLIGDAKMYYQLDALDADFSELFKVLADFDSELQRGAMGARQYAEVIANIVRDDNLLHFDKSGVCALIEHGARIVSRAGKLTARFGRIADLAREASFLAEQDNKPLVCAKQVELAVKRTKMRASLPSRKFQEQVDCGTIVLQTQGAAVAQVNGLAVMSAGPVSYGFPARITATIGPGQAGLINIEGQAAMSGAIHTKGFHILGGVLRHMLKTEHPLAFSASIAFEQSYGGIDGDSASGAEMCCLLSALTGIALSQSIAMTGAIDQHGNIQAIGGVNEKIEGFFGACAYHGLTGDQGVIIPAANAGDLMLRQAVLDACAKGQFAVYAIDRIEQALQIFTSKPPGEWDITQHEYTKGSLLHAARQKAREYWQMTLVSPSPSPRERRKRGSRQR